MTRCLPLFGDPPKFVTRKESGITSRAIKLPGLLITNVLFPTRSFTCVTAAMLFLGTAIWN